MLELLDKLGLPTSVALAIAVTTTVMGLYLRHRLALEQQRQLSNLEVMQRLHNERLDALKSLSHFQSELRHAIYHLRDGNSGYRLSLERNAKLAREWVREHRLLLSEELVLAVNSLTDVARAFEPGGQDDTAALDEASMKLWEAEDALIRKIPGAAEFFSGRMAPNEPLQLASLRAAAERRSR
jgi:hypothetical protein